MIDAAVSITTEDESYNAGRHIAKEALGGMNAKPKLAILAVDSLARVNYKYGQVLKGVREELGPAITIIGSTANGVLINNRYAFRSAGLMLLGGDINIDFSYNYPDSKLDYENIAEDIYQKSQSLPPKDSRIMIMFQDGYKFPPEVFKKQEMLNMRIVSLMSGLVSRFFKKQLDDFKEEGLGLTSAQELLESLYSKSFDLPIAGNVVTNVRNYDSVEFYNDEVGDNNVVGAILSAEGESKFGFGFGAGAESTGKTLTPTKKIGGFFLKVNGDPALEGFCDAAGIKMESLEQLRPFGYQNPYVSLGFREETEEGELVHLSGLLTNPNLSNLVTTSFPFNYEIPEEIEIFRSNINVLKKTTEKAIKEAIENISNPKFLLGFDCFNRAMSYGDMIPEIIKKIEDTIGKDVPRMIIGAGGEIFGKKGLGYYNNNMTFVTLAGGN
ncbi:MAG: hypothetical protein BAJALOKI1v1_140008 [Promethearchaeota archaeon]|nr:MAG: hypothetical protein BAJALOKI1v1_140008 [Candidatus Lokiarchaeota archaeon]